MQKSIKTNHFQSFVIISWHFKLVQEKFLEILHHVHTFFKEKFDLVIFYLKSQKLVIKCKKYLKFQFSFFFFLFCHFQGLKLEKYKKIVRFPADALSFTYFPQINTLVSNISSSILKIWQKIQKKMMKKTKWKFGNNSLIFQVHILKKSLAFSSKYLGLEMKQYYANTLSLENFHWKKNLLKIL